MSDNLPYEVISNIFFRLPIKYLVICTAVCKLWRSMIKSSSFIQAHISHRISLHGTHLLLLHGVALRSYRSGFGFDGVLGGLKREVYSLHYDNIEFNEYCKISFHIPIAADRDNMTEMSNECFRVVSICNGLVFLADDISHSGYKFIMWNPFIKKLLTLPKPGLTFETVGGYHACHGFAFDVISNDYKAVRIVKTGFIGDTAYQTCVEVYSLAAGSWSDSRLVDPQCRLNMASPQAFVNGALHWDVWGMKSSSTRFFVLAFDVSSELSREILFPKSLDPHLARPLSLQLSVLEMENPLLCS